MSAAGIGEFDVLSFMYLLSYTKNHMKIKNIYINASRRPQLCLRRI